MMSLRRCRIEWGPAVLLALCAACTKAPTEAKEKASPASAETPEAKTAPMPSPQPDCLQAVRQVAGRGAELRGPFQWNESMFDADKNPGVASRIALVAGAELFVGTCVHGEPSRLLDIDGDGKSTKADLRPATVRAPEGDGCAERAKALIDAGYSEGGLGLVKLEGPYVWTEPFFDATGNPGLRHRGAFLVEYTGAEEAGARRELRVATCIEGEPSTLQDLNEDGLVDLSDLVRAPRPRPSGSRR